MRIIHTICCRYGTLTSALIMENTTLCACKEGQLAVAPSGYNLYGLNISGIFQDKFFRPYQLFSLFISGILTLLYAHHNVTLRKLRKCGVVIIGISQTGIINGPPLVHMMKLTAILENFFFKN